jgi:hypothetical protein
MLGATIDKKPETTSLLQSFAVKKFVMGAMSNPWRLRFNRGT